jgi:hypothetical protein
VRAEAEDLDVSCGKPIRDTRRSGSDGTSTISAATVRQEVLEVIGRYGLTEKRLIEGDDHSATLKILGVGVVDLTTQHYVVLVAGSAAGAG